MSAYRKTYGRSLSHTVPATIDDPQILDEIAGALRGLGYTRQ